MLHPKRRSYRRLGLGLLAVVLLAVLMSGCGKKDANKVVAVYEGGQVTNKEFASYKTFMKMVNPMYASIVDEPSVQESILKQFVAIRLLSARASDEAKTQGQKEADDQFAQIKKSLDADAATKKAMKDGGLTEDQMKQYISEQMIMLKDADLKVTDDQVKAYYDKNKAKFDSRVTVRHILIGFKDKEQKDRPKADALKLANEVKTKLEAGGDWTELAKEYSDDSGSASTGGLYENADPESYVEAFKNAAKTLPIGKISDPVETEYGYHVMKVEKRGQAFDDKAKEEIKQTLSSESIDKFMSDELPKLIKEIKNLPPIPSPSPSASPSASAPASPSASSSAGK
ncbi:peptidylprolyl isomerase [Cohnella nanjingensis]|uniref:Peptidylprolyl isomerase n=1 Tax=Cohnella nanjingensis TaxID=1387779 RepID=A0A7X0VJN6_9BACL|nr:peptidylprolyl isomerase [Cohnella nanjingensis]MBB6674919.1 peptidylprolyl isomerase [Cohnella nanjingensis]